MRIALDAMGGDNGVAEAVAGAARYSRSPGADLVLVGQRDAIASVLAIHAHDPSRIEVVHSPHFVPMEADARATLDVMPEASINLATRLVAEGQADALVSAGPTAATILATSRRLQRLDGIRRAALAAVYPTQQTHGSRQDPFGLMLDVGATVGASAEELVGFAVMGSAYARIISENARPSVALLSNGAEANRGTPEIVEAHRLLLHHPSLHFVGNVEGLDIARGTADVVVCNGFIGNIVLKMLEGFYEVAVHLARDASHSNLLWKLGLMMLQDGIQQIRTITDWRQYGGAPLLGFNRVVIKAHGRSNARAVRNALKVAERAVAGKLVQQIAAGMATPPVLPA